MMIDSKSFIEKMKKAGLSDLRIAKFQQTLRSLESGETGLIGEAEIQAVKTLPRYEELQGSDAHLSELAMVKLNGGLGTSMGLEKAKSLISIKKKLSLLDITAMQVKRFSKKIGRAFPLVLMNSFKTSEDSLEALQEHSLTQDLPFEFLQSKVPKVEVASGLPAKFAPNPELEWCPPGHGDIYLSLLESGILEDFRKTGIKYLFVSNIDNLGATVNLKVLQYFAQSGAPFLMEVTRRTEADKKGGHLAQDQSGRLLLRELAQCPEADIESFQNIEKHRFFNTNNLWLNLEKVSDKLASLSLPLIVNRKTVNPSEAESEPVIQTESAMGAAIGVFDGALALEVPRTRFVPVKKTSDLLLVRSDLYQLTQDFELKAQKKALPNITLSKEFKFLADFERRFPGSIGLNRCESLKIEGDFLFQDDVEFVGHIDLKNLEQKAVVLGGLVS